MARQQTGQANQTFNTATGDASQYGGNASAISGTLTPFLTQRLLHPEGYSQGDMGAMLANALGSGGGATSAITGQANLEAGRMRNDAGFSPALDAAARARTASAANASEGIAANNADLKQSQSNNAARMLQGLYGTDVGAQNEALNTANNATNTGIEAQKSGWFQNMTNLIASIGQGAAGVGKLIGSINGGGS